ncbi:MAG: TonB-dependent receptor [bacterium]
MKKNSWILAVAIGVVLFKWGAVLAIEGTSSEESKIKPQEMSIIGKDRSAIEVEEEDIIMKPLPSIEPPAYTIEEVKPPKFEPEPVLPKKEEIKKPISQLPQKMPKPTLYSFGLAYGNDETLLYDFTHSNETKEVGYYFHLDRGRADGFTYDNRPYFNRFSQDCLSGETIVNFPKYSWRTEIEYLNKDLTLPYQGGFVENKLRKSVSINYEVKVPPESKMLLGLDIGKGNISSNGWLVKNNAIGAHLGFLTPFKKGNPPLSIGTDIYHEKLKSIAGRTLKFYSLYAEGKRFKMTPKMLLDAKVSLDKYENSFSSSQLDFLFNLHYTLKEKINMSGSIERKLSLPTFDELYVNRDYSGINSKLEPEKSWKYKMDANYQFSDELFLEGAIWTQRVDKYIIWTGGSPTYIYCPENIGKAKFSGLELGVRYYFSPKLSQNISYSCINAKNKSGGEIPNVPENRLKMGLRYKDGEKLTINLNTEYADSSFGTVTPNIPRLKSYFLVNITAEKKINDTLYYSFSCENLLGEDYEYLLGYPGQKRRFALGIRLRF